MPRARSRVRRILDFDIENRPLTYWVPDRPTTEITAIAACWADDAGSMKCWLLGKNKPTAMLKAFVKLYDEATMVTGHYIRRHDLPIINAHLAEYGLPLLKPKLTQDTKMDLVKWADLPKSQEYLLEMLGMQGGKKNMTQAMWRKANRLAGIGRQITEERVTSDVRAHIWMRENLIAKGMLGPPKEWRP